MNDSVEEESVQCLVCKEEGKTTPATHWCSDCETLYCDGCLNLHNRIPSLRKHEFNLVTDKKSQQRRSLTCKEHDETIKLFCKDCNKPLCKICRNFDHKMCKEVITIKVHLRESESKLQECQQNLAEKMDLTNVQIQEIDSQTQNMIADRTTLESDIRKTIKEAIDALKQKEDQLIKKVKDQTEQDKEQLRSMMKTKQMDLQLYQQQYQSIQQALELEDKAHLFEMYLSSESGADVTGRQRKDRKDLADISIKHDLAQLKEQMEMMVVSINKLDLNIEQIVNIDLTTSPISDEIIDANLNVDDSCGVRDGLVLNIAGTKVTVFADCYSQRLKSFFSKGGQSCSSVLKVPGDPWSLAVISEGKVAVSLPLSQQIIIFAVTPDLEFLSTIQTSKNYRGMSTLDPSTLVVGSNNPSSVDLIDMKGTILKTFTTLPVIGWNFIDPFYIHVTRQGTILVSDFGSKSVICLTQSGDIVFTYTPIGDRALVYPRGITSTSTGDILVADYRGHKVIHLSNSGKFIRNILTEKDGLDYPTGLCVDEDKLCVMLLYKGLHKYRFC